MFTPTFCHTTEELPPRKRMNEEPKKTTTAVVASPAIRAIFKSIRCRRIMSLLRPPVTMPTGGAASFSQLYGTEATRISHSPRLSNRRRWAGSLATFAEQATARAAKAAPMVL